jgi:WD40 repeat protein
MGTGGADHRPATHTARITCCAFSPSGLQLATGSRDGTVCIWDSRTGVPIGRLLSHSNLIRSMSYHEWQGAPFLVVHNWDKDVTVWNMSVTPPSIFSTPNLPVGPTRSPSPFQVDHSSNRTFVPTASISFYLPSSFRFYFNGYSLHEARIAYGGADGSIILIDCSHLLPKLSVN